MEHLRHLLTEGAKECMTADELAKTKRWRSELWALANDIEERVHPPGAKARRERKQFR